MVCGQLISHFVAFGFAPAEPTEFDQADAALRRGVTQVVANVCKSIAV